MKVALVENSAGIYGVDHQLGADSESLEMMEDVSAKMGSKAVGHSWYGKDEGGDADRAQQSI